MYVSFIATRFLPDRGLVISDLNEYLIYRLHIQANSNYQHVKPYSPRYSSKLLNIMNITFYVP
jgi:hypothetical protein